MAKEKDEKIAEISARVSDIIECCATTPNNFAKVLGYGRAQTIYDIISGKSAPSYDFFRRFSESEYSAIINLKWLLSGDADMWTDFWQSLPHETQIEVADMVNHNISVSSYKNAYGVENKLVEALLKTSNKSSSETKQLRAEIKSLQVELGQFRERAAMADTCYNKTLEQAEIIGLLKARIKDLESRLEKTASSASIGDTANVG